MIIVENSINKNEYTYKGFKYNYADQSICFPDYLDKSVRMILTSEEILNRSTHYIEDKKGIRTLTPKETVKINGFPDD